MKKLLFLLVLLAACKSKVQHDAYAADEAVNAQYVNHIVREGESTRKLARRYHMSRQEIRDLNPALKGEPEVGTTLVLYRYNTTFGK